MTMINEINILQHILIINILEIKFNLQAADIL